MWYSRSALLAGVAVQAVLRVLDQQITERKTELFGPGREPLGQPGRQDERAAYAVVALPHLVGHLRHVLSSPGPCSPRPGAAPRSGARCDRSAGPGNSGWESPVPEPGRPPPGGAAAGAGPRPTGRPRSAARDGCPRLPDRAGAGPGR